jgi:hypothetical protein
MAGFQPPIRAVAHQAGRGGKRGRRHHPNEAKGSRPRISDSATLFPLEWKETPASTILMLASQIA